MPSFKKNEKDILEKGVAFPLVEKLLQHEYKKRKNRGSYFVIKK